MLLDEDFALQIAGMIFVGLIVYLLERNRKSGRLVAYSTTVGLFGERVTTIARSQCPITDEEDQAMLLALVSRSSEDAISLLKTMYKTGSSGFMKKFYIGFGHKSIGDCASAVMLIQNVSLLAAKHIQHDQLYRGIESSTRYIDFFKPLDRDKFEDEEAYLYAEKLMQFYRKAKAALVKQAEARASSELSKADTLANVHDVCRGFLPVGVCTTVGLRMSVRQLSETIQRLRNNPLPEVASIADSMLQAARTRYPNSFGEVEDGMNRLQNSTELQTVLLRDPPPLAESFPVYTGKVGNFVIPPPSKGSIDLELYYPTVRFW
jgi:thymidylate synthase ThyX